KATTPEAEPEPIVETTVDNPTLNLPETGKFYIIMGAFKSPELAEGFCDELRLKGYRGAEMLYLPHSQFRYVSLQNYTSYKEASRCLKEVQDQMQTDAWLMTGK
ncbi:SPOR domain-containing protein, partial [Bacteroidales bacterium OttesenSCG-928-J16]|nr:SPOR domain-containing protein [Bacteroidales bacterium OttesenSCG-928-J16]